MADMIDDEPLNHGAPPRKKEARRIRCCHPAALIDDGNIWMSLKSERCCETCDVLADLLMHHQRLRMMPRLECFRCASNCGFINASRCIGAAASDSATGSTAFREIKLTSMTTMSGARQALAFEIADIGLFHRDHLGVIAQRGMQLLAPDIDCKYDSSAFASRTSVMIEAAGRGADRQGNMAPRSRSDRFQARAASFTPPRVRRTDAPVRLQVGVLAALLSDGFTTGLSLAVTRPASIAARARARLSKQAAFDSKISARLRGEDMLHHSN